MHIAKLLLFTCSIRALPPPEPSRHSNFFSLISNYLIYRVYGPAPIDPAIHSPNRKNVLPPRTKYTDDVVLRFNISSEEEAESLSSAANTLFLDIWESNRQWADIRLAKDVVGSLLGLLPDSMRRAYTPLIHDLSQAIHESTARSLQEDASGRRGTRQEFGPSIQNRPTDGNLFFRDYQPLSVIIPWMRLMQSMFSAHVRIIEIGTSYEGRSIMGLRVGVHPSNAESYSEKRKTILVTGGSHAREWVSVSSVTYAAYALITSYGKSKLMTKLIEDFDWVFVPTLNPDGYAKTWEHDRLWRKNTQETSVRFCQGYDIDRSFAFEWDGDSTKGNPCSESFAGEAPLQAIEALRLANWVKNETTNSNANFVGFLDLHSYSQQILYPYAFSCIQTPPTLENLEELGLGLSKAIHQTSGDFYGVASACEGSVSADTVHGNNRRSWPTIESNGGSALDWMYHEIGTKYAFQIKLPDTGSHGFLLPRKYIIPTGEDFFSALSFFGNYLLGNKGVELSGTSPPSAKGQAMDQLVEQGPSVIYEWPDLR